jgi:hypothetical protein
MDLEDGLVIQQIFRAHLAETVEAGRPSGDDLGRVIAMLETVDGGLRADEENCLVEMKLLLVEAIEDVSDRQTHEHGAQGGVVCESDGDTLARLPSVGWSGWRELRRSEADTGDLAGVEGR